MKESEDKKMAGYSGYSMSNNAVDAYENGEKPYSKWTKQDLLIGYSQVCKESGFEIYDLSKIRVDILKRQLLVCSSWHHTSSRYNKTDFYEISVDACERLTEEIVKELISLKEEKTSSCIEKWEVSYLVWSGTRNHPRATEYTETVDYDTSKSYVLTEHGKKKISANGFRFLKKL